MVFIYKFCLKENLIQPPEELREPYLGEIRPKKFTTQNFVKDKMSGRVDLLMRIL